MRVHIDDFDDWEDAAQMAYRGNQQPCRYSTETVSAGDVHNVRLANCNGPLQSFAIRLDGVWANVEPIGDREFESVAA